MTGETIFFSYSRKDSDFVLDLGTQLRNAGAKIWLDQLDIEPGTNWDDSIEAALQDSSTLLVILSKTSVLSKNVSDEYSYAIEEGKRVVPVLLEPCDVPFRLRRLQYADFSSDPTKGIKTLITTLGLNQDIANNLSSFKSKTKTQKKPSNSKIAKTNRKPILIGILILFAIVFGLFKTGQFGLGKSNSDQLTILVHDVLGKDQLVLPNRGQVKLIYGDANVVETINSKGEATFKQIPEEFFDKDSKVEILFLDPDGEPYRAVHSDSSYTINSGEYISLPVKLFGLDKVRGIVKNFVTGDPISNVRISISGVESFSNDYGEYELSIPIEQQRKYQTIRAFKEGFELYEISNVPIQTDQELPIVLKPK